MEEKGQAQSRWLQLEQEPIPVTCSGLQPQPGCDTPPRLSTARGYWHCQHGPPRHGWLTGYSCSLEKGPQAGENPKPRAAPRAWPICPGWWEATGHFPHPQHPEREQPLATGLGLSPRPFHTAVQALLCPSATSIGYVYNGKICSKTCILCQRPNRERTPPGTLIPRCQGQR